MRWSRGAALSAAVLLFAAQVFQLAPLRDAATGAPLGAATLTPSLAHLLLTPLCAAADWATCLGFHQLLALLAWLLAAWWLVRPARGMPWRGWRVESSGYALYVASVLAFIAWTVVMPRPVARLTQTGAHPLLVLDFHSHTSHSWDARRSFTPERSMAWHRAMGYDAAFVTDHNRFDGARLAFEASRLSWRATGFRALRGEELSLHGAHVVALGNREAIDPEKYAGPEGLPRFLSEARSKFGALPLLSLPEYWKHHSADLEALADSGAAAPTRGAAGFEIANAAPKAEDAPPELLARVVNLCRARDLFVAGVSDNHGWARSACAWSLMDLPGHASMDPEQLEGAVLDRLSSGGFAAVTVAERPLHRPGGIAALAFDPPLNLWQLLRSLSRPQVVVCVLYIAALAALL